MKSFKELKEELKESFKYSADEIVSKLRDAMEDDMTWEEGEQEMMEFLADLIDQKFPDEFGYEEMQELMNDPQVEEAKDKYLGHGTSCRDWFMEVMDSMDVRLS